ncbi:carboxymuconolactone decarboxylase family protein [candidate division GN15 bacterium]|nr:carboxymuconolactone decarboxylase family protein [candidate division GN15 bacterium]
MANESGKSEDRVQQFVLERQQLNDLILARDDINIKRFFGIDNAVYRDGALDAKTKELLGLVASLVLRCDDCIAYHVLQAADCKATDTEFDEVMSIGLVVGGSITIPHVRRAYRLWKDVQGQDSDSEA